MVKLILLMCSVKILCWHISMLKGFLVKAFYIYLVWLYACVHVCAHAHVCRGKRSTLPLSVTLQNVIYFGFWDSLIPPGWLAWSPWGPPISAFPTLELPCECHIILCYSILYINYILYSKYIIALWCECQHAAVKKNLESSLYSQHITDWAISLTQC